MEPDHPAAGGNFRRGIAFGRAILYKEVFVALLTGNSMIIREPIRLDEKGIAFRHDDERVFIPLHAIVKVGFLR